jgi:hypothetical protein
MGSKMKRALAGIFCGLLIAVAAGVGVAAQTNLENTPQSSSQLSAVQTGTTQNTPAPTQAGAPGLNAAKTSHLASGSVIPITLTKTVDAKKAKVGDQILAKVTDDLKSSAGEVLLTKNARVVGHVTQVQAHSKEQKESQLGVVFDRIQGKNGSDMQMPMLIQAVISFQSNGSQNQNNNTDPSQPSGGGSSGGRAVGASAPALRPSAGGGMSNTGSQSGAQASGSSNNARPAITAQTQGVIGIANLTLNAGLNPTQGSVLSSEKNNVKLESGTMMLLRVN